MSIYHCRTACISLMLLFTGCSAARPEADNTRAIDIFPSLEIGAQEAEPDKLFGRIRAFTADSQGFTYIVDDYTSEIRRFDADGQLVWKSGRKGEGPGEFDRITYLGVGFGRIYAVDRGKINRITVLDAADGKVLAIQRFEGPNSGQYTNGEPIRIESSDHIAFGVSRLFPDYTGASPTGWSRSESMLAVDLGAGTARRISLPYRLHRVYPFSRDGQPDYIGTVSIPFEPTFVWTPNPLGGATYAWGGEYRIIVASLEGDTIQVLGREVPPRRVSGSVRVRAWEEMRERLTFAQASGRDIEAAGVPQRQAQIYGLAYSRDGSQLWVQRTQFDANPVYDVFIGDKYACTIRLDLQGRVGVAFFQHLQVVNNRVFQYAQDEKTDVPIVVRFDLSTHPQWRSCAREKPAQAE